MPAHRSHARRRWRDYRTASGRSPVKDFILALPLAERAVIAAAMKDIALHGNSFAHDLRGDIYEVRARTSNRQFRLLYATEGRSDQVLLALHGIVKKSRTVPGSDILIAEQRLKDWRTRRRHH